MAARDPPEPRTDPHLADRVRRHRARPQVTVAAWAGVLAAFVFTLLGPTFNLWDWVLAISPFWHIPNVADSTADGSGLGWISLVTILFLVIGFRRRELATT